CSSSAVVLLGMATAARRGPAAPAPGSPPPAVATARAATAARAWRTSSATSTRPASSPTPDSPPPEPSWLPRRCCANRANRRGGGMKGSKKVLEALNDVLGGELVGINQYFLH